MLMTMLSIGPDMNNKHESPDSVGLIAWIKDNNTKRTQPTQPKSTP